MMTKALPCQLRCHDVSSVLINTALLLLPISYLAPSSYAFTNPYGNVQSALCARHLHLLESFSPLNDASDEKHDSPNNSVFYDDFDDANVGNFAAKDGRNAFTDSPGNIWTGLHSRIGQTRQSEVEYDAKLARNWRRGNWSVRGFSLDNGQSSSSTVASVNPSMPTENIAKPSLMSNRRNVASTKGLNERQITPVHISVVAAPSSAFYADESSTLPVDKSLPEERAIAVGRTDGSVFIVQLGSQYLTKFSETPKIVLKDGGFEGNGESAGITVQVEKEWMNLDEAMKGLSGDTMQPPTTSASNKGQPFQILLQFQASPIGEPINSLVFHDIDDGDSSNEILCTAVGDSGEIQIWALPSSSSGISDNKASRIATATGVHSDKIISLKTMVLPSGDAKYGEKHVLFSASKDGTFALWDLSNNGGLIVSYHCVDVNDDNTLTCADVSNPTMSGCRFGFDSNNVVSKTKDMVFLGTSEGYVIGYIVKELLQQTATVGRPVPNIRFRAHGTNNGKGDAITAITCGNDGTIPMSAAQGVEGMRPQRMSSLILLTGGEDGSVKQWEILSQESLSFGTRMEHWPRLSTQRMQRRCHLFPGHNGPVTTLAHQSAYDSSKFLSCGRDGSIFLWSAASGDELFRMDGFSENISSLACIGRDLLVTNGMGQYVCVNDFGIDEDAASEGYDLEW
mmetsp:Transcript_12711/g.27046  ORF Transcript_12711/g.27046 Transcript_12711/m.27046 type:complete len:681 (-) Transcript_12711:65-2107(-)